MIKIIFCLRKLPELSLAQFHEYWLNEHAPLVRQHAEALSIKRYVQSHTFSHAGLQPALDARGPEMAPFDGVAELWWESLEQLLAVGQSPESRKAGRELLLDERKFIDLKNSPIFYAREQNIFG